MSRYFETKKRKFYSFKIIHNKDLIGDVEDDFIQAIVQYFQNDFKIYNIQKLLWSIEYDETNFIFQIHFILKKEHSLKISKLIVIGDDRIEIEENDNKKVAFMKLLGNCIEYCLDNSVRYDYIDVEKTNTIKELETKIKEKWIENKSKRRKSSKSSLKSFVKQKTIDFTDENNDNSPNDKQKENTKTTSKRKLKQEETDEQIESIIRNEIKEEIEEEIQNEIELIDKEKKENDTIEIDEIQNIEKQQTVQLKEHVEKEKKPKLQLKDKEDIKMNENEHKPKSTKLMDLINRKLPDKKRIVKQIKIIKENDTSEKRSNEFEDEDYHFYNDWKIDKIKQEHNSINDVDNHVESIIIDDENDTVLLKNILSYSKNDNINDEMKSSKTLGMVESFQIDDDELLKDLNITNQQTKTMEEEKILNEIDKNNNQSLKRSSRKTEEILQLFENEIDDNINIENTSNQRETIELMNTTIGNNNNNSIIQRTKTRELIIDKVNDKTKDSKEQKKETKSKKKTTKLKTTKDEEILTEEQKEMKERKRSKSTTKDIEWNKKCFDVIQLKNEIIEILKTKSCLFVVYQDLQMKIKIQDLLEMKVIDKENVETMQTIMELNESDNNKILRICSSINGLHQSLFDKMNSGKKFHMNTIDHFPKATIFLIPTHHIDFLKNCIPTAKQIFQFTSVTSFYSTIIKRTTINYLLNEDDYNFDINNKLNDNMNQMKIEKQNENNQNYSDEWTEIPSDIDLNQMKMNSKDLKIYIKNNQQKNEMKKSKQEIKEEEFDNEMEIEIKKEIENDQENNNMNISKNNDTSYHYESSIDYSQTFLSQGNSQTNEFDSRLHEFDDIPF